MSAVRIAVVQLGIGRDRAENLRHCLEKIDEAAAAGAQVIVLPEFCNYPSFYESQDDAYERAEPLGGPFLAGIADAARRHHAFVSVTVTVPDEYPRLWNRQVLFSPNGDVVTHHDKEVLFGQENDYITPGLGPVEVAGTAIGRVGLYSCMDGVVPETTRIPALAGAQLLLNSLNSCSRDEGELHIPVRAAENHVWLAAANKAFYDVPGVGRVYGGRSEVVDPTGKVLARANSEGREEIVWADVELALADDKTVAGGGHLFEDRRPDAYGLLAEPRAELPFYREGRDRMLDPLPARLAVVQAATLDDARRLAVESGARVLALPERFDAPLDALRGLAREAGAYVGTSMLDGDGQFGILLDPGGEICLRYRQVHVRPAERVRLTPGDRFETVDTPFGRIGLMVGYDGLFPESARVLGCLGADIIVYPTTWVEEWEVTLGAPERADENRVHLLAAARLDSPIAMGSLLVGIERRETVRGPNILLNCFEPLRAPAGIAYLLTADVDVSAARIKAAFRDTDVLFNRRPELYARLKEPAAWRA